MSIRVSVDYYLKLFPASYMRNVNSGKGLPQLKIDWYSKKADMIKNGWVFFETLDEMEKVAVLHDTSPDMRGIMITPGYSLGEPDGEVA